jgi:hypothetical protein
MKARIDIIKAKLPDIKAALELTSFIPLPRKLEKDLRESSSCM